MAVEFCCMRTPTNFPEGTIRTEISISGTEETNQLLFDLIAEIEEPFDSYEAGFDEVILVYTSPEKANRAFNGLYRRLCGLYPWLIGAPNFDLEPTRYQYIV